MGVEAVARTLAFLEVSWEPLEGPQMERDTKDLLLLRWKQTVVKLG